MTPDQVRREVIADLGRFTHDPLGFVLWAFPWGVPGTSLESEDGPDTWQREQLKALGDDLQADGTFWYRGQTVDYDGVPDWKLEPVEAEARAVWEVDTAQPERVENERQRGNIGGIFEEGDKVLPSGTMPVNTVSYPPSGWGATNV